MSDPMQVPTWNENGLWIEKIHWNNSIRIFDHELNLTAVDSPTWYTLGEYGAESLDCDNGPYMAQTASNAWTKFQREK